MAIALYPGTFDPVTLGHMDIIARAVRLFDEVIVAVYRDAAKPGRMFDAQTRIDLLTEAIAEAGRLDSRIARQVRVEGYTGLSTEYARGRNATVIVRGLRAVTDFEYEFKLAHMNHHLAPEIEVVCLMSKAPQAFVSSSLIREVAGLGGDVASLVPPNVLLALARRPDTPDTTALPTTPAVGRPTGHPDDGTAPRPDRRPSPPDPQEAPRPA